MDLRTASERDAQTVARHAKQAGLRLVASSTDR